MKWGLGDSYDKVSVLSVKTRAWLDLTKPLSTVGVMGAYTLGIMFYLLYQNQSHLIVTGFDTIIYAVVTIGFAHAASQALNMAEDADMDRETPHKKDRPIPAGIVSEEEARTIAWFLILAAVGRAYITRTMFGIFVSILVFFGIFYNLEPIRAKERIISIPWQAASRGLLLFPTIWSIYGNPLEPLPWIFGVFMFFYALGFQNSADIIDKKIDEKYGIKTFVVMFGTKNVALIASICSLAMLVTIVTAIRLQLIPSRFIGMNIILIFCAIMIYYMMKYPDAITDYTGNHPSWIHYYVGMVLTVAIPLMIEIYRLS